MTEFTGEFTGADDMLVVYLLALFATAIALMYIATWVVFMRSIESTVRSVIEELLPPSQSQTDEQPDQSATLP